MTRRQLRRLNQERGSLIERNIAGALSPAEAARLTELNAALDQHLAPFLQQREEALAQVEAKANARLASLPSRSGR